jgi:hypothetical protein
MVPLPDSGVSLWLPADAEMLVGSIVDSSRCCTGLGGGGVVVWGVGVKAEL